MAVSVKKTKVLVVVFLFIFILLLSESVLRIKHYLIKDDGDSQCPILTNEEQDIIRENKKILYEYKPYILWRGVPNQVSKVFKTNAQGLRGDDFHKEKGENVYRIVILGGSAAWGYGATSNNRTISYLLENDLNQIQKKKRVEVLNFAENGYNSSQEIILLREISEYKPDLVIHYTGYNDIYVGLLNLPPGWNHSFIQEGVLSENPLSVFAKAEISRLKVLAQMISNNSRLYQSIKYRLDILFEVHKVKSTAIPPYSDASMIAEIFSKNMVFSTDVARDLGFSVLVILQPSLFTETTSINVCDKKILSSFEKIYPFFPAYYNQTYDLIKQKLIDENINFIDGKDFFKNTDKNLYFDTVHYFDDGIEIVAKKISDIIISKGLIH